MWGLGGVRLIFLEQKGWIYTSLDNLGVQDIGVTVPSVFLDVEACQLSCPGHFCVLKNEPRGSIQFILASMLEPEAANILL